MKRKTLACMFLVGTAISTPAFGATIEVRPGDNLNAKIRSAKPGDTVAVYRGVYNGSVNMSGLHGQPGAPIRIVSVDGHGAAVIRGSQNKAAVQASRITNVEIDGFHVVANAPGGGDVGGFKIWGDGQYKQVGDLKFTNNLITGVGQDGFKIFNGAKNVLVAGNTIDGNWRQEGIDNVSVKNVRYEGNTIKGKAGFAGITWKAGSDGVQFVNNTVDIDADTAVSVGGYGNSRLARMDRFPDEYKDNEAANSVVTGNKINGHVRVISAENNRITDNDISGSISNGRNSHMPGSITSRNNTIANNGAAVEGADEWDGETPLPGTSENDDGDSVESGGGFRSVGSRDNPSQFDRNADQLGRNFFNTDEQFWRSVERGEAGATRRFNDLVSGGILFREGNKVINRATGEVTEITSGVMRDTVDSVMDPVEDYVDDTVSGVADSIKCNVGGGILGAGATAINAVFTGGRSTFAGQVTEHMLSIAGNLCMSKQLGVQNRMREEMRLMRKGLNQNGASPLESLESGVRSTLGSIDNAIYSPGDADSDLQETYQNGMDDDWTYETSWGQSEKIREKTAAAAREAARVNAATQMGIDEALDVSDQIMELSQGADGQTQAIQANTQMARTLISIQAMQHGAQASSANAALRAEEERRALDIIAEQKVRRFYARNEAPPAPTGRALFQ